MGYAAFTATGAFLKRGAVQNAACTKSVFPGSFLTRDPRFFIFFATGRKGQQKHGQQNKVGERGHEQGNRSEPAERSGTAKIAPAKNNEAGDENQ